MYFTKLSLIAVLTATSFTLHAEDKSLEYLIVSGTRSPQTSVQIPASIQVLTAEDIKLSGASNLIQVLNAQAGIQIKDQIGNGGRSASISMRGFGENNVNNVLILVDGRKLNNPSLASPNLASIAIRDIERVEIIQGSAGTLYGDQATGGVINIITKQAKEMSAYLEAGRGTDDWEVYRGAISQRFDSGVSYRISGEKKLGDNYRDNNESNYSNLFGNLAYENKTFQVFAEVLAVEDDLNLPGSLNRASIRSDRRQTFTPNDYTDQDTDSYRLGGKVHFSKSWALAAEYTDRTTESEGFNWGSNWEDSIQVKSFNPRLLGDITTDNGQLLITAGLDLQESTYDSTLSFTDSNQDISDIYAQVVFPATKTINITVGGRYSELDEKNNNTNTSNDDSISVYQIGVAYQPNQNVRIFLRRDESFRWANIDENGFIALPAGEILKPQESVSWEAGIEQQFSELFISAMFYDMNLENEIYYDPTVGFFGANSNLEESDRKGIVLDSNWQLNEKVSLKLNYSYVDAEVSAGLYDGNTVPFVAKQTANFTATYQLNDSWSFYADAQYTGDRYQANDDSNSGDKLGGYTLFNANVRWDIDQLYINFRTNNISGKKFEGFTSIYDFAYPSPERTYEVTIGYNF